MTLGELLRGSGLPWLEAQVLARHGLGLSRAQVVAETGLAVPEADVVRVQALFARRRAGEPVAYLTGEREFYGLSFTVTPAVLIPRPETELLVDYACELLAPGRPARVLDLGTGSGCVAIAVASERPAARVTAVDASAAALEVARANAARLGAPVTFVQSDWFAALGDTRYELILGNPPYVAAGDPHLGLGDVRFEPQTALVAGADGLDCIRAIVAAAGAHLVAGGHLAFEHGYDQAAACRALLSQAGFVDVGSRRDLAGIERMTCGARPA